MVITYFDICNSPVMETVLFYPFSRGASRSSETLSDLPEVTQLGKVDLGIEARDRGLPPETTLLPPALHCLLGGAPLISRVWLWSKIVYQLAIAA